MMQWVLGDAWGWRSLDGQSAAESEANRRNGARFILELNGGMAVLAVLAVALIPLSGASTADINAPLLLACVGFGALSSLLSSGSCRRSRRTGCSCSASPTKRH